MPPHHKTPHTGSPAVDLAHALAIGAARSDLSTATLVARAGIARSTFYTFCSSGSLPTPPMIAALAASAGWTTTLTIAPQGAKPNWPLRLAAADLPASRTCSGLWEQMGRIDPDIWRTYRRAARGTRAPRKTDWHLPSHQQVLLASSRIVPDSYRAIAHALIVGLCHRNWNLATLAAAMHIRRGQLHSLLNAARAPSIANVLPMLQHLGFTTYYTYTPSSDSAPPLRVRATRTEVLRLRDEYPTSVAAIARLSPDLDRHVSHLPSDAAISNARPRVENLDMVAARLHVRTSWLRQRCVALRLIDPKPRKPRLTPSDRKQRAQSICNALRALRPLHLVAAELGITSERVRQIASTHQVFCKDIRAEAESDLLRRIQAMARSEEDPEVIYAAVAPHTPLGQTRVRHLIHRAIAPLLRKRSRAARLERMRAHREAVALGQAERARQHAIRQARRREIARILNQVMRQDDRTIMRVAADAHISLHTARSALRGRPVSSASLQALAMTLGVTVPLVEPSQSAT